jgi:phage shock protein PspC (stress-responsive transcriptional regulator)
MQRIKAAFAAFFIAIAFVAWPLFLTATCVGIIFYVIYRLIREEQKSKTED